MNLILVVIVMAFDNRETCLTTDSIVVLGCDALKTRKWIPAFREKHTAAIFRATSLHGFLPQQNIVVFTAVKASYVACVTNLNRFLYNLVQYMPAGRWIVGRPKKRWCGDGTGRVAYALMFLMVCNRNKTLSSSKLCLVRWVTFRLAVDSRRTVTEDLSVERKYCWFFNLL
jgi:hypothetical protein